MHVPTVSGLSARSLLFLEDAMFNPYEVEGVSATLDTIVDLGSAMSRRSGFNDAVALFGIVLVYASRC